MRSRQEQAPGKELDAHTDLVSFGGKIDDWRAVVQFKSAALR
jgi:hypothetical protein